MVQLRKDLEKEIYDLMDDMDPSGRNTERVRAFFATMDDLRFMEFIDEFFENPDKNFAVAYEPYNHPVTMDFVHAVAKKRKVPIYERVFRPYLNGDTENPPGTVHPMMVLDVPVKRLKQMAYSRNHASTAAAKRDPRTGQVTGEDRTARVTDVEAFSLFVQGQYNAAQEFYGPMADDTEAHFEMLRAIQRDGEVELRDLPNDPVNKVTLNTINVFMLGSGLQTNFINEAGYVLPITLKGQEDKMAVVDRG